MKGIISALFSLKKELSFVLTKNGKLTELRIVASKEDAISIGEKLAASTGASVQGNQRFTFAAGEAALDYVQEIYSNEQFIEGELTTAPEKVVGSVSKLVQENLELKKEKDRHLKETVEAAIANAQPLDILGKESIFYRGQLRRR